MDFGFSPLALSTKILAKILVRSLRIFSTCSNGYEPFACLFCLVLANHIVSCLAEFGIEPVQGAYHYLGPTFLQDSNSCLCSNVRYSLLSACGVCRGAKWITYDPIVVLVSNFKGLVFFISWSDYALNCLKPLPSCE